MKVLIKGMFLVPTAMLEKLQPVEVLRKNYEDPDTKNVLIAMAEIESVRVIDEKLIAPFSQKAQLQEESNLRGDRAVDLAQQETKVRLMEETGASDEDVERFFEDSSKSVYYIKKFTGTTLLDWLDDNPAEPQE